MTVRNLEFLFRPRSVAVVAEPDEPSRYAEVVIANLVAGGFAGPVISVGARKRSLFGIGTDVRLDEFEVVPDLAIICATLDRVPSIITQLGARGHARRDRWALAMAQDEQQRDRGGAQGHP
jgi:acetyltransferase